MMELTIKPIREQILFKPFPSKEKSEGGIIVPEAFMKISDRGEIIAIGNNVKKVKVGDVGYRVYQWGLEVQENGEKYFIMDESAILAID